MERERKPLRFCVKAIIVVVLLGCFSMLMDDLSEGARHRSTTTSSRSTYSSSGSSRSGSSSSGKTSSSSTSSSSKSSTGTGKSTGTSSAYSSGGYSATHPHTFGSGTSRHSGDDGAGSGKSLRDEYDSPEDLYESGDYDSLDEAYDDWDEGD